MHQIKDCCTSKKPLRPYIKTALMVCSSSKLTTFAARIHRGSYCDQYTSYIFFTVILDNPFPYDHDDDEEEGTPNAWHFIAEVFIASFSEIRTKRVSRSEVPFVINN